MNENNSLRSCVSDVRTYPKVRVQLVLGLIMIVIVIAGPSEAKK